MDAETQTDSMDLSETELSPTYDLPSSISSKKVPQRVILREIKNESDDEGYNGNSIQLRYVNDCEDSGECREMVKKPFLLNGFFCFKVFFVFFLLSARKLSFLDFHYP